MILSFKIWDRSIVLLGIIVALTGPGPNARAQSPSTTPSASPSQSAEAAAAAAASAAAASAAAAAAAAAAANAVSCQVYGDPYANNLGDYLNLTDASTLTYIANNLNPSKIGGSDSRIL